MPVRPVSLYPATLFMGSFFEMTHVGIVNFDFAQHWDWVVPFLGTKKMQSLLEQVYQLIKENHDYPQNWKGYNHSQPPALNLTSHDAWVTLHDMMIKWGVDKPDPRIPQEVLDAYEALHHCEEDDEKDMDSDESQERFFNELWELEAKIEHALEIDFPRCQHMSSWLAFGTAHWFNPVIGLYLANKVCPGIKWKVLISHKHATVVSIDNTKMFDLLAYGWESDRIDAYCFNDQDNYTEEDPSLGATQAMEMLMSMDTDDDDDDADDEYKEQ